MFSFELQTCFFLADKQEVNSIIFHQKKSNILRTQESFCILQIKMAIHNELGKKGELLAANFLLKKGYTILEKNWRYLKADVDIIAQNKGTLVIVEVKTRSSDYFGDPQDFINPKKIQLLVEAANEYVISRNLDVEVRFDIIAILLNNKTKKIEHLENAFLHF